MSGWTIVTGAAGFIGAHVVDALVAAGRPVIAVDRRVCMHRPDRAELRVVVREVAALAADDLRSILPAGDHVDALIHLAAQISVPRSLEDPIADVTDNVIATLRCGALAREFEARLVFASSAAVYGEPPAGPVVEEAAGWPRSPYGVDKLAAEMHLRVLARERGLRAVALRFFNVYGPRSGAAGPYDGVIARFLDRALAGEALEIFGDGAQTRDFVHVDDVVAAILAAAERGPCDGAAINVGSGVETSIVALADAVIRAAESASPRTHLPGLPGEIQRSAAAIDRARTALGVQPQVDLDAGLRALVRWRRRGDSRVERHR